MMFSKIIVIISMLFFLSLNICGQQYEIKASVWGNGGTSVSNSNIKIISTIGQSLTGSTQNISFQKQIGFWKPAQILITPTDVVEIDDIIPREYKLEQNYPNPFNPSTTISYQIPELSNVVLKVYDVIGREIQFLVNEEKDYGTYELSFNASDFASGIYFYRLDAKSKVSTKHFTKVGKMVLLK